MQTQFWVIGAEFNSVSCNATVPGTGELLGPYPSYDDAHEIWRERSMESRALATTRYTIVCNAPGKDRR